jgi:2-polyprenyl-3-methyl-5-hydroxy-6-metoxy-1,4-benzoquinol methylase
MSNNFSSTPSELWDSVAGEYDEASYGGKDGLYPANKYRSEILLGFFETAKKGTVLDAGCGTGQMTRELLKRGWDVTSVDYSKEMLAVAEQKTKAIGLNGIFIHCDLKELAKLDRKFDYIMLNGVLPYVAVEEEPQVFEQLRAVSHAQTILLSAHYNLFFNLLSFDNWTVSAITDTFLSTLSAAERNLASEKITSCLSDPNNALDDERTMKMESPIAYSEKLKGFGFAQQDLAYYNFFYLPGKFQAEQKHDIREKLERELRRDWRAVLLARGFVSIAKRSS